MEYKTGIIKYVAKTKGLIFEGEDGVWYNPTNTAKPLVNKEMEGKNVTIKLLDEGNLFSEINMAKDQDQPKNPAARVETHGQTGERISRHGALNTAIEAIKLSMQGKQCDLTPDGVLQLAESLALTRILPFVDCRPKDVEKKEG